MSYIWGTCHDAHKIEEINERKKRFLGEAYFLIKDFIDRFGEKIIGIEMSGNGLAQIKYQYPIIKGQKIKSP